MAEEFVKTGLMDGMGESDDAPEDDGGSAKYSLPFGLCKKYGIPIGKNWTPRDAWAALKGKGVVSDVSGEYDELDKTGEQGNESQDGTNPQEEAKANGDVVKFSTRDEAIKYLKNDIGMIVSESTNVIPDNLIIPNMQRLANLEKKFGAIKNNIDRVEFSARKDKGAAAYVDHFSNGKIRSINLCRNAYFSRDSIAAIAKQNMASGYIMPFADEQADVYNISHEYGHAYFNQHTFGAGYEQAIEQYGQAVISGKMSWAKLERRAEVFAERNAKSIASEIISIVKESNINADVNSLMSDYGKSDSHEWLAEAFANSQCGKPNEIGKAMLKYLERSKK